MLICLFSVTLRFCDRFRLFHQPSLLFDFQSRHELVLVGRAGADHDTELTWFYYEAHLAVVAAQLFGSKRKFNQPFLSWAECDSPKTLQFPDGPGDTGGYISNIKLDHLIAGALAGVREFDADSHAAVGTNAPAA